MNTEAFELEMSAQRDRARQAHKSIDIVVSKEAENSEN